MRKITINFNVEVSTNKLILLIYLCTNDYTETDLCVHSALTDIALPILFYGRGMSRTTYYYAKSCRLNDCPMTPPSLQFGYTPVRRYAFRKADRGESESERENLWEKNTRKHIGHKQLKIPRELYRADGMRRCGFHMYIYVCVRRVDAVACKWELPRKIQLFMQLDLSPVQSRISVGSQR